ncbi:MAG: hypothetical protein OSB05_03815 [Akkermansiaceae bacterium]|nr:hypothetical protein [Akkermansiaceae bacterium]
MSPERVFQILAAIGLIAGGWFYGDYWRTSGSAQVDGDEAATLRAQNSELTQRVDELNGELAQVRSMLSSGPYPIPDDLIAWIEKDYGMVFLKSPDVRLASPTAMRDAAQANLELIHGELGLEKESVAWELLGLLPQNQNLLVQLVMVNSDGAKGIFDLAKGQILISESFDPVSVPDRSVLARLLAQQLSFQNHPQKEWSTRDEWQAWEALHSGAAAALQARFLRRNAAANEAEWRDPEANREELLNELSPVIQGLSNFPFLEGADYSRHFYIDSREAWSRMFRETPTTTARIIHPNREPIAVKETIFPDSRKKILATNQLGELGLRLWLEPYAGVIEASPLAEEWRGDQYRVFDNGEELALTWILEMSSEKSAAGLVAEVKRSMLGALGETQPERVIKISSEGTQVVFTNSPTIE